MAERKISFGETLKANAGFTLMEVMIAIAIFTVFATVFVTGQGYNLMDSGQLKDDLLLKDLAENKINEIIVDQPELRDAITLSKETKEIKNFPDYQTTVEYKKFFVPELSQMKGESALDDAEKENSPQAQMEKRIFKVFKENMEKMIWQVEVTVKNKNTNSSFKLSTWLYNKNADVQIDSF